MSRGGGSGILLRIVLLTLGAAPLQAAESFGAVDDAPTVAPCSQRYASVATAGPGEAADPVDALEAGFGARRLWGAANYAHPADVRAPSGGRVLRVFYPAGTSSPSDAASAQARGGGGFYTAPAALAGSDHACLSYWLRFPAGFDFVQGGKLPGLYGGDAPSGGRQATGTNGFSLRFMWRRAGQGELYAYLVAPQSDYGVSLGRGRWRFPRGQWVRIEQELVLNTPGQADGLARVWLDDTPVFEQRGLVYRTTADLHIDGLMFSTFFGGTGEGWRTPRRQHVDFADFRFYRPLP